MLGTSRAGAYRAVLRDRRLVRVFSLALIGRFGYALFSLCLLFTIAQATGSFAVAASSLAVFGVSGLVMPVQARLLDRYGQRRVLPLVGILFTSALAVMAVMGARGTDHGGAWFAVCLSGGLCAPSLGPSMRAQWREAVGQGQRPAAYSLDAVAEEVVFFLGPAASSLVLILGPAWCGVAAVAVLIPIGIAGLVVSPFVPLPSGPGRPAGSRLGPLRRNDFRTLLVVMMLAGAVLGAMLTALAALADQAHRPSVTGIVEALAGLVSVAGGLWWGARRSSWPWRRELAALMVVRLPLVVGCVLLPHLWSVAAFVTLSAVVVSPLFVAAFTASDQIAAPPEHTEASTWVTSVGNIGSSGGTALAGWGCAEVSVPGTFAMIAVLLVAATGVAQGFRYGSLARFR
ncbi:MFS transporter [Kineosporia mesophila]|uniref:MFS transporter n=1 Tax=Kineosporia mesophila TaxID=566012 RepID=A0ABP7AJS3_9ACTN|nr:MFS transporter [Kineosporia mesophila]MCD5352478.1 MFS transporter [Kineosporia mesophila]